MRKILSIGLFLLSFFMVTAQITVNEGFEGSTTPTGWVYTGFARTTSTGYPCTGTAAIRKNLYGTTTNITANAVYSSTVSNGNAIDVSFNYSAKPFSTTTPVVTGNMKVEYSADGGTTYTQLGSTVTFTSAVSTCTAFTGNIPAGAVASGASFKFRITGNNTGSGDWYLTIDDVKLTQVSTTPPNCTTISAPANAATSVSITPAISWATAPGATSYLLNLGTTAGGTDILNGYEVTSTSYTIPAASALNYNTMYYITIVPKNANGTATGCAETSFTTTATPACPTVTAPASAATGVSVTPTFTWSAVPNVTGYKITVGTTSGGTDILNAQDVGNVTSYALSTPLNYSTTYYYSITAYAGTTSSTACTVRNFTTQCSSVNVPYNQNFESVTVPALPSCTSVQNAGTGNNWVSYSLTTASFGFTAGKVLRYSYNTTNAANTWFYTPGLNLTGGTQYVIKFRVGSSDTAFTEKMKVAYGTSAVNTAMTNLIADYPEVVHANSSYDTYYFTPATTGVYYVGFNAYSALDQAFLYLDDITIDVAPSCTLPGVPTASGITQTDATVSWTAATSSPANGYDLYYSTSSTAPTVSTTPNYEAIAGLSQALSGLTAGTTYYVWVRSNCSTTEKSDWTSAGTFSTTCLSSVPAPYTLDFESANAGGLPNCSTTENLSSGNNWSVYNNATTTLTGKWLICPYNVTNDSNAWFYTTGVFLEAGKSYKITYNYAAGGSYVDKLKVAYGTAANSASMTTVLADYPSLTTNAIQSASHTITIPTAKASGVYYFGFNAYSAADQNFVAIDNIAVVEEVVLGTDTSVKDKVGVYPNPFHDVVNISDIVNVKSISVTDISGRNVKTIDKPTSTINLGNLKEGLYIISLHMKDGSVKPIKVIKK